MKPHPIINGPVQVIAELVPAKLKYLTSRIAYLIENGINPREILALDFYKQAAREMKERIALYIGEHISEKIWRVLSFYLCSNSPYGTENTRL